MLKITEAACRVSIARAGFERSTCSRLVSARFLLRLLTHCACVTTDRPATNSYRRAERTSTPGVAALSRPTHSASLPSSFITPARSLPGLVSEIPTGETHLLMLLLNSPGSSAATASVPSPSTTVGACACHEPLLLAQSHWGVLAATCRYCRVQLITPYADVDAEHAMWPCSDSARSRSVLIRQPACPRTLPCTLAVPHALSHVRPERRVSTRLLCWRSARRNSRRATDVFQTGRFPSLLSPSSATSTEALRLRHYPQQ